MGIIQEITDKDFDKQVIEAELPALVLFTSPECVICKRIAKWLKELAVLFPETASVFLYDINKNKKWQGFEIYSVPTLIFFKQEKTLIKLESMAEKDKLGEAIKEFFQVRPEWLEDLKAAIDAEYLLANFYRYVYENTKNGRVKAAFAQFHPQSNDHQRMLEEKYKEVTGKAYKPDPAKFVNTGLAPQNFSLEGAIEMAIKTEKNAIKFYKNILKKFGPEHRQVFKDILKQESNQMDTLKKEKEFIKDKELFSPLKELDYSAWMGKRWA